MGKSRKILPAGSFWGAASLSTFVSVGNAIQSFHRLLNEVIRLESILPKPLIIQYGHTLFNSDGSKAVQFLAMSEFERLVFEAKLLIFHAGAGSVMHAVHAGKIPVVMARRSVFAEHVDDHQVEFADALEKAGRVIVAHDVTDLATAVQQAINIQQCGVEKNISSPMLGIVSEIFKRYEKRYI